MDIFLTHGYFLREDEHEKKIMKPYAPLGILYISAYLKARGFNPHVFDTTFSSPPELTATLERARPAIVGIYCNLMTRSNVLAIIAVCKRIGAYVVLGGPEPPHHAGEYLARGADVIVIGEGEITLEELIPALMKSGSHDLASVAGIIYRDADGNSVRTAARAYIPNVDVLPRPDRTAIDMSKYLEAWRTHHGRASVSVTCARGCPYHCAWCSHSVYGETHRRHSPARVADEVSSLIETYHPDQLWYADDVFTIHHGWLAQYADELERRGIKLPFECISRADRLNDEVIGILATMGCERLWLGSESGSQRLLDAMRRDVTVEQIRWAAHALHKRGIRVGMFAMLGYEGEHMEDIRATLALLKAAEPDVFLTTVAYPIKGTPYYQQVQERILVHAEWDKRTDRDLSVRGRRSQRFYEFAQRWMVGEFNRHRQWPKGRRNWARLAKSALNASLGRLGMVLTRRQIET